MRVSRVPWLVAGLGLGLLVVSFPAGAEQCRDGIVPRTELGRRHALPMTLTSAAPVRRLSHPDQNDKAAYVRPLLELVEDAPGEDWYVVVRDAALHPIQTLGAAEFRAARRRWTARVPGTLASVHLTARPGSPVRIKVIEYLAMPAAAERPYYSVRTPGSPTWVKLYEGGADDARPLGDAVGMLMSAFGQSVWCCSGVLVAPDLLLTNWHCGGDEGTGMSPAGFWTDDVCRSTLVDFSWDDDRTSREYLCKEVVVRSRPLDYALLRVAPVSDLGAIPPARLAAAAPGRDEPLYVIHHPQCLPKRVSDCKLVHPERDGWFAEDGAPPAKVDFTHRCDTEGGSSGAPIFAGGKLVGLHHLGYRVDDACKPVDDLNKAVAVQHILDDLGRCHPAIAAQLRVE
jgi:hypothetical protein